MTASRFVAHRFRELHPYEAQAVLLNACNLRCRYCLCPEVKTALLTTEHGARSSVLSGRSERCASSFKAASPPCDPTSVSRASTRRRRVVEQNYLFSRRVIGQFVRRHLPRFA